MTGESAWSTRSLAPPTECSCCARGRWWRWGSSAESVTALHAAGDALLAGTYGGGLFRSVERAQREHIVAGLTASTFRFVSGDLAGTKPARVYRSSDGGRGWEEFKGVTRIPGHERWFLPYSPRAGAARNAYVSGDRLLVAAEVAGLLAATTAAGRGYASRLPVTRTSTMSAAIRTIPTSCTCHSVAPPCRGGAGSTAGWALA